MSRPLTVRVAEGDALPALIGYIIVLVSIPSALIVHPLGAAGTPAQIIAIAMFAWWVASRVLGPRPLGRPNPVKWFVLIFAVALIASYVAGMSRAIFNSEEVSSADRSMLSLCAWCGIALVMADGIRTRARLDTLLRVVGIGVTGIAVLGIVQFAFRIDLAHVIHYPGLTQNTTFGQLVARSTYDRVSATTNHPIEFGVVLSAGLPLLLHFARFAAQERHRRLWWLAVGLVSVALPMCVARSAMLGAAVVLVYLFHTWPGALRLKVAIIGGVGVLAMTVAVPGLLGTIRGLFTNASEDPSTQGRTADYAPVIHYVGQHPLLGRGIGTFLPSVYRTLDNAYLGLLVEAGLFGMLAFLLLFAGSVVVNSLVRRAARDDSTRDLAQCLKASLAAMAVNAATFDALGFAMCAGMIFVYVGATGALWNIESRPRPRVAAATTRSRPTWPLIIATAAVVLAFGAGALGMQRARPTYYTVDVLLAQPPPLKDVGAFATTSASGISVSVLRDIMRSATTRATLASRGAAGYEVALFNGSLETDTDVEGDSGPVLYVRTTANTAAQASRTFDLVFSAASAALQQAQREAGVAPQGQIRLSVLQRTPPFPVVGRPSRAHLAFVILFAIVASAFYDILRRRRARVTSPRPRPAPTAAPALATA